MQENNRFTLGARWLDNNGIHINAHGGGLLFHDGIYYWFGEHKIEAMPAIWRMSAYTYTARPISITGPTKASHSLLLKTIPPICLPPAASLNGRK